MSATTNNPGSDSRSDPELISQTRAGDSGAFEVLWQRHYPATLRAARALVSDPATAEDAVQDTFISVSQALARGRGPDVAFRPYVLTSLRHTVARRQRQASHATPVDEVPDSGFDPDDPTVAGEERTLAVQAFASLPERYRTVLWHAEIEQEPLTEVGALLGIGANAAAQLLVRARRQLRRAFLQANINQAFGRGDADCRVARSHMGAYVDGSLSNRERAQLEAHVEHCDGCRDVLAWVTDLGAGLRAAVLPVVLGGTAATGYLAHGTKGGFLHSGLHHARSHPVGAAAGSMAVVAAIVVSALAAAGAFTSGPGRHVAVGSNPPAVTTTIPTVASTPPAPPTTARGAATAPATVPATTTTTTAPPLATATAAGPAPTQPPPTHPAPVVAPTTTPPTTAPACVPDHLYRQAAANPDAVEWLGNGTSADAFGHHPATGTGNPGPSYAPAQPYPCQAFLFDGNNGLAGTAPSISTSAFTIALDIHPSVASSQPIDLVSDVAACPQPGSSSGLAVTLDPDSRIGVQIGAAGPVESAAGTPVPSGQWSTVVLTVDVAAATVTISVNGTASTSALTGAPGLPGPTLAIANGNPCDSTVATPFAGMMDDIYAGPSLG